MPLQIITASPRGKIYPLEKVGLSVTQNMTAGLLKKRKTFFKNSSEKRHPNVVLVKGFFQTVFFSISVDNICCRSDRRRLSVTQKKEVRLTETQNATRDLPYSSWTEHEASNQEKWKDLVDSGRCGYIWKQICPQCGKEFYTMNRFRKYCHLSDCRSRAKQERNEKKKHEHYSEHICPVCSAYFISKRTDARFCSNACRQKAYREKK